ncbi:MAG: anti-sigma factor [Pyrinomonadaceae bacterium]
MSSFNSNSSACETVQAQLDSYVSQELSVETTHRIAKHLENCRACAVVFTSQLKVKELVQRAVRSENTPPFLREKIQREIRADAKSSVRHATANISPFAFNRRLAFAAVILVALCLGVWSVKSLRGQGQQISDQTAQADINQNTSTQTNELLTIGLLDHLECALGKGYAQEHNSHFEMSQNLGAAYEKLLPLTQAQAGDAYEIVAAHHCDVGKRSFTHLILRNGDAILSLVITRKKGEAFPADGGSSLAVLRPSGVPLYQGRLQNFAVAGFETPSHLAFVVSNLSAEDNLRIAAHLAPSVRDFLAGLEATS